MLRLTVTVVQIMDTARVIATLHQEDPWELPTALGEARQDYDMGQRLDHWDELTSLVDVLRTWCSEVNVDKATNG